MRKEFSIKDIEKNLIEILQMRIFSMQKTINGNDP